MDQKGWFCSAKISLPKLYWNWIPVQCAT